MNKETIARTAEEKIQAVLHFIHGGKGNASCDDADSLAWVREAGLHEEDDYSNDSQIEDLKGYVRSLIHPDVQQLYDDEYIERMCSAVRVIDGDAPMKFTVDAVHEAACNREVVRDFFSLA